MELDNFITTIQQFRGKYEFPLTDKELLIALRENGWKNKDNSSLTLNFKELMGIKYHLVFLSLPKEQTDNPFELFDKIFGQWFSESNPDSYNYSLRNL